MEKGKWCYKFLGLVKHICFRSSHRRCSVRKDFLKISWNLQENTCTRTFFLIKFQALPDITSFSPAVSWKKRSFYFSYHFRFKLIGSYFRSSKTLSRFAYEHSSTVSLALTVAEIRLTCGFWEKKYDVSDDIWSESLKRRLRGFRKL